jgi:hypothetical protein
MNDIESIRKTRGLPLATGTGFGAGFSAAGALDLDGLVGKRKV